MIDYKALCIGVCNTCLSGKSVGKFAMKATEYQYKGSLSELTGIKHIRDYQEHVCSFVTV